MSVDETSLINEIIETHVATMRAQYTDDLETLLEDCESPIERVFGAALLHDLMACQEFRFSAVIAEEWEPDKFSGDLSALTAQHKIGPYRVDFFVEFRNNPRPIKIAIECDGHDFHERTKEQARKDRSKDRWLQSHGCHVLRFTGSEIWKDPIGCAEQVLKLIWNRLLA